MHYLTTEDVIQIHGALSEQFAESGDPISPAGVRSQGLLESAVNRQHASFGGVQKYANTIDIAASLMYGLCMNHPFHNGNKRTALVAGIIHLDRNERSQSHF